MLSQVLLIAAVLVVSTNALTEGGKHVCSYGTSYQQSVTRTTSVAFRTCTGWFWRRRCYNWYQTRYYKAYETRYRRALRCCSGYTEVANECIKRCLPPCARGWCNHDNGVCQCPSGWTGSTCSSDVNECYDDNGGCQYTCINTRGSYHCSCPSGYQLDSDGKNCNDVNECYDDNGGCQYTCLNTPGSYHCSCPSGYQLDSDGKKCSDVNECLDDNGGCQKTCLNTPGSYHCSCPSGYQLDSDGKRCSDVNECYDDNGGCQKTCLNTPGSYNCSCPFGYQLDSDGKNCSVVQLTINTLTVGRTGDPTSAITITPTLSQPVKLECQRTNVFKDWFTGDPRSRVTPTEEMISTKSGHDRTLLISSFQPIHTTTYSCIVDHYSSISTVYPVVLVIQLPTVTVGRTDDPTTTITITPTLSLPVKLECRRTSAFKDWFTGDPRSKVTPTPGEISTKSGHDRTLLISSFNPCHATTYSCIMDHYSSISTVYPVVLETPVPEPPSDNCTSPKVPTSPQVKCVRVTGNERYLSISWSAVTVPLYCVSYVVAYSTSRGTETAPPDNSVETSGITDTSTTLTGLQAGSTYYVWVAAEVIGTGVRGPYSQRASIGESSCADVDCTKPGIVSGITAAELNQIAGVGARVLEREVGRLSVPNIGDDDLRASNIRLESFSIENLRITPSSSGITLSSTINAGVDLDWRYCRIIKIKICDDGNADVNVTASLSTTLKLLVSGGKYNFTVVGTNVSVSNLDIDIGENSRIVYNFLNSSLRRAIGSYLTSQLSTLIEKHGSEAISSFPKTLTAFDKYSIDFTLLSTPRTHSTFVSTAFKGAFFRDSGPFPQFCPTDALPETPPSYPHCSYYFYVSDFFANTIIHALYPFHFEHIIQPGSSILESLSIPEDILSVNKTLKAVLRATSIPRFVFNGSLTIHFSAKLKIYSIGHEGQICEQICELNLDIIVSLSMFIRTRSDKHFVLASFSELSIQPSGELCPCFGIDINLLIPVINPLIKASVLPELNKYGAEGIPIPEFDHIDLIHPMIHLKTGYAIACFDLNYNP